MVMETIKNIIVFVGLAFLVLTSGGALIAMVAAGLYSVFSEGIATLLMLGVVLGVVALMGMAYFKGLSELADRGWLG